MQDIHSIFRLETNSAHTYSFQVGEKVRFFPSVEKMLIDYYIENNGTNEAISSWLTLGSRILNGDSLFQVLHVAREGSVYPLGTVVIELDVNLDIEVTSQSLEPVSRRELVVV